MNIHTDIVVRRATESDLPEVLRLMAQEDMSNGNVPDHAAASEIFSRISSYENHELYVAIHKDDVIGSIALLIMNHLCNGGVKSAVVEDVVVRFDWQRRGVGRLMNEFVCRRAIVPWLL